MRNFDENYCKLIDEKGVKIIEPPLTKQLTKEENE